MEGSNLLQEELFPLRKVKDGIMNVRENTKVRVRVKEVVVVLEL